MKSKRVYAGHSRIEHIQIRKKVTSSGMENGTKLAITSSSKKPSRKTPETYSTSEKSTMRKTLQKFKIKAKITHKSTYLMLSILSRTKTLSNLKERAIETYIMLRLFRKK